MKPSEIFNTSQNYSARELIKGRPTRNFYTYYNDKNEYNDYMDTFGFSKTSNIYLDSADIADFENRSDDPDVSPETLDNHRLSTHYDFEGDNIIISKIILSNSEMIFGMGSMGWNYMLQEVLSFNQKKR